MAAIISPKTDREIIDAVEETFGTLGPHPAAEKLWHGNFRTGTSHTVVADIDLWLILTGYSGATVGQAIFEYDAILKEHDNCPCLFLVGSCFATKQSALLPGQIAFASDSFSPDSFEQRIYECASRFGMTDPGKPDCRLLATAERAAAAMGVPVSSVRVYSRISPGVLDSPPRGRELMDRGMWYPFALEQGARDGFDVGEYETAAFLATCKLLGLPALAILDVKDKLSSDASDGYAVRTHATKISSLQVCLHIARAVLRSLVRDNREASHAVPD